MRSPVAFFYESFVFTLVLHVFLQVNGQCTTQGCEMEDLSNSIVAEILEIKNLQDIQIARLRAIDHHLSEEQFRRVNEFQKTWLEATLNLTASIQEMRIQQNAAVTSLGEIDHCSQEKDLIKEQIKSIREIQNATFNDIKDHSALLQQIKNQQNTTMSRLQIVDRLSKEQFQSFTEIRMTLFHEMKNLSALLQQINNKQDVIMPSLQAVDRRSQEQAQNLSDFRKTSLQEIKYLSASLQQVNNTQHSAMINLQAVDRRLNEYDIFIKNQTQAMHQLSQKQELSFSELRKASLQELKNLSASVQKTSNKLESFAINLQAIERRINEHDIFIKNETQALHRRSQEQDINIKQTQGIIGEFLNASIQQMRNQLDAVMSSVLSGNSRLEDHAVSIRNETQTWWKLAIGKEKMFVG